MDPFIKLLPTVDVHGYTADETDYKVSEYINDNIKMGNKKIVVIHGIGAGILKTTVRTNFKNDKRVKKLYGDAFNLGITIIELNI